MEDQENIHTKRNVSDNLWPILLKVENPSPSAHIHIDKDEFNIGRGRANDELIAHVSISRQHCIFKRTGTREWTIQNVSSSGTFINGTQLAAQEIREIKAGDTVQFGVMSEFSYKFELSTESGPVAKKPRITAQEIDLTHIVMRQKTFEESQQMERNHLAEKMKVKHIEQLEWKNELQKLLNDRDAALGQNDDLNKQINKLKKMIEDAEMNVEKMSRELAERLDKERQEFETKLNEEKKKMKEALEISRKENEILENNMKEQLEKLRNEQQIECKKLTESLSEEKKTAEKLQNEKVEFAQKLKEMEDALVKSKARANELQTTLEKQNATKTPQVVALGTVAENVEIVGESNITILDTIDLTVDRPDANLGAQRNSTDVASENVFNKVGDIMDEQLTCSICSELFVTAMTLNCTHTFCQYCINTWMKKKKECPVCRTGITAMNRSLVLDNFIDKMVENLSSEYKKRRTEIVEERRANEKLANEAANQGTGKRGRGRARGANANRTGTTSTAATSGTGDNNRTTGRTERTDNIQHRGAEARNNQGWNNVSGSSGELQQQPAVAGSTTNYEQTPTTTQGTSNSSQQTNDNDDNSTWSTSTEADRDDTNSFPSSDSGSQTSEDPEVNLTDGDNISMNSDDYGTDISWENFDHESDVWSESADEQYVEGIPGAPYGGYGACYKCGHPGHWAPGCPYS